MTFYNRMLHLFRDSGSLFMYLPLEKERERGREIVLHGYVSKLSVILPETNTSPLKIG